MNKEISLVYLSLIASLWEKKLADCRVKRLVLVNQETSFKYFERRRITQPVLKSGDIFNIRTHKQTQMFGYT